VTCDPVHCSGSQLFVPFAVDGPGAGDWDPSDHVVIVRPGDDEELRWLDGVGGIDTDGTAFFVWRLEWPGGDSIQIRYFDADQTFLAEQVAKVDTPDPNAGLTVLTGRSVLVDDD
jgi:hypothetical protein